ncbi:hypothetical protein LHGZ1_0718 [Laribacter hongkongensis]|uniref:Uncharacterized protein n=1 Tax=Laribacter hongkongensis TaxID=168471 RepID=A0A248LGG0_9NEIS|nr:hypothetical protein LHGZ1_0718 [Laribacter hongkongensis]
MARRPGRRGDHWRACRCNCLPCRRPARHIPGRLPTSWQRGISWLTGCRAEMMQGGSDRRPGPDAACRRVHCHAGVQVDGWKHRAWLADEWPRLIRGLKAGARSWCR